MNVETPTSGDGLRGEAPVTVTLRCARWLLAIALRCWPAETRAWGLALAAEVDEASSGFDAMWWWLGGLMFFARTMLASVWKWMKLPAGSSLPGGLRTEQSGSVPKRSRLFTAAVLACTTGLLLLPEGREAVQTVKASWLAFMPNDSDQRTLDKLAERAEKDKDAETLAFVALSPTGNAAPEAEQRKKALIERTVALDPSFIWIYGATNHNAKYYPAQKEWLQRLQAADPDNAVPILLEANALAEQQLEPGYADKDYEALAENAEWMALMARAYAAPNYDSYVAKHIRVMREVWDRDPSLPPDIFLMGLWSHGIPDLRLIRNYAEAQVSLAKKTQKAGDGKEAEAKARGVAGFGARMTSEGGTLIEQLIGVAVSRIADKGLTEIYTAEGKSEEARQATAHFDELEHLVRTRYMRGDPGRAAQIAAFHREAAFVQGSVLLGGVALLFAVAGILSLELWPRKKAAQTGLWRRVFCAAADWAPVTLLAASGAFLICFLPFQKVLADFRVSSFQVSDEIRISDAMWSLVSVPEHMFGVDSAVAFWSAVTYTLSAIVVCMVAWGIYRSRRAQTKPA